MTELHVAPSLSLPRDAALQRNGILAMSGAGKSNTAVVMAEEMFAAGIPWVAIDPKGDWWGIRSSADGKEAGLAVPVFGGLEGDVPLEETAGKVMAELVAEKRLTCVLDVSEFPSKAAQLRFLTDFAQTLLRKNRAPLHVFAEEADEYLPQRVMKSEAVCVGAWTRLVKRGRFRGVFVTLITQRSAALNKDALSQLDTLIPMRVGDPRDKKAISEWVVQHAIGKEMFDSLPFLEDGEAWIWSPQKLKLTERVTFRRRRTFDSGATPDWDERPPAKLADIDLTDIEEQMAATIERAEAEDPKKLQRRIRELESGVNKAKDASYEAGYEAGYEKRAELEPERVEVAVLPDGHAELLTELHEKVDAAAHDMLEVRGRLQFLAEDAGKVPSATAQDLSTQASTFAAERGQRSRARVEERQPGAAAVRDRQEPRGQRARRATPAAGQTPPAAGSSSNGDVQLKKGARTMLLELAAYHPGTMTRRQLATSIGIKSKGTTFSSYLSNLRTAGLLVEDGDRLTIDESVFERFGIERASPKTPEETLAMWRSKLKKGAREMLDALVAAHPDGLERIDLADALDINPSGTTFSSYLSNLRTNELITEHGSTVYASEDLV